MSFVTGTTDLCGMTVVVSVADVAYLREQGFADIDVECQDGSAYIVSAKCPPGWTKRKLNEDDRILAYTAPKTIPK